MGIIHKSGVLTAAAVACSFAATTTNAIPITVEGNIYTLTAELTGSSPTSDTYKVTYMVNTAGFDPLIFTRPLTTYLHAVEFGIGTTGPVEVALAAFTGYTFLDAPGGMALWNPTTLNLNASGCPGPGGNNNKLCIFQKDTDSAAAGLQFSTAMLGGSFSFMTSVNVAAGTVVDGGHVKVNYWDTSLKNPNRPQQGQNGKVGDLVSMDVAVRAPEPPVRVPEPSSISLIMVGLALLMLGFRRRAN